ncbi:MAG: NAD(P)-dependent oxidoreductase, partial [Solirubrobacteraceae bacterium]
VGVIGLGVMGAPMARNLLRARHDVTVHSRSQGPVQRLVEAGATAASTPAQLASRADVVVAMLPGEQVTAALLDGDEGLWAGARAGSTIVDMSTASPAWARALAELGAERGVAVLDAPVSGGDAGAQQGTLSIMAGGKAADVERVRLVLEALGTVTHVGGHGAGQTVKLCNQLVVGGTIALVSEALVLAAGAGVEPAQVIEVLSGGLAANRVMELRGRNFLEHDFEPGGKASFQHRDLGMALDAGRAAGVPLPVTALVDQLYAALLANGGGELDHSALITVVERLAGRG